MISLEKTGNAIKFTFDDNGHYLQDGTIEVPVNSLTLVTDESDMFTFKKSATNDIFVSGLYSEIGMSKSELETFYKNNMVDSFINADEAQSMIDESISGKADYSAATVVAAEDVKVTGSTYGSVSFDYEDSVYYTSGYCYHLFDSAIIAIVYSDGVSNYTVYINGSQSVDNENYTYSSTNNDYVFQTKGSNKIISFNVGGSEDPVYYAYKYFASNEIAVSTAIENIINPKLDSLDSAISVKADTSAVTAVNNVVTAHTADTTIHVTSADKTAWNAKSDFSGSYNDLTDKPTIPTVPTSNTAFTNDAGYATSGYVDSVVSGLSDDISTALSGKQDTLVSGTNIKTINNESILGSGNIDIQGGGKAIEAGRGISITTGETADTVSFNLPISAGTGNSSIVEGQAGNRASGSYSHAEGSDTKANGYYSHVEGYYTRASGQSEHASGQYNVSNKANNTWGDSGNTLFSVGNGTSDSARHNAFEIRQNGDIYLTKDGQDIKLQDNLGSTVEVSSAITSGDTNAVAGGAVYDKFDEVEQVTARALNGLAEADEVAARALIDLNDKFGGLKLQKLTQAQYDALSGSTDSNTLYVIVN